MTILKNIAFRPAITLPPSKSEAQRYLICAAFADAPTEIYLNTDCLCQDIKSCIGAISALGAGIEYIDGGIKVTPVSLPCLHEKHTELNFGESGTLERILLPVLTALKLNFSFSAENTLKGRPVDPVLISGELKKTHPHIIAEGSASSQTVSGLLFALALTGGALEIAGKAVSYPYIRMTLEILREFGASINCKDDRLFELEGMGCFRTKGRVNVSGDWSAATFPLTAGLIGKAPVSVSGLSDGTYQGDRKIIEILEKFGGKITSEAGKITAYPSKLISPGTLVMTDYPDLVPAVAVCAACTPGDTEIAGIGHLAYKESNRLDSLCKLIGNVGGQISVVGSEKPSGLLIRGAGQLSGGNVSSFGDHRIAMAAYLLATVCSGGVTIDDTACISKSWPGFEKSAII